MIRIRGSFALIASIIVGVMIAGCSQAAKSKDDCMNLVKAMETANAEFTSVPIGEDLTKMTENGHRAAVALRAEAGKMSNAKLKELTLSFAADYDHFGTSTGKDITLDSLEQEAAVIQKECGEAFRP